MIKKTLITSWAATITLLIIAVQTIAPASADFVFDYSRIVSDSNQATSASFDLTGSVVDVANSGTSTDFQLTSLYASTTTPAPVAICGNSVKEAGEACDGTDFGGLTCANYGYNRSSLQCLNSCQQISSTSCYTAVVNGSSGAERDYFVCGDGRLDPNEQCDDGNKLMGDGCDHNCDLESGYQLDETTGGAIEIEAIVTEITEEEVSESETPIESTETTEEAEAAEKTVIAEVEPEVEIVFEPEIYVTEVVTPVTTQESTVTKIVTENPIVEPAETEEMLVYTNETSTFTDSTSIATSTDSAKVIVNTEIIGDPEILITKSDQTFSTSPNYIIKDQRYAIADEGIESASIEARTQLLYVRYLMLVILVFVTLSAHWIYRSRNKSKKKSVKKKGKKKKNKFLGLFSIMLAILMTSQLFTPLSALSADTNPKVFNYEGKLLDSARDPVTTAVTMRFSLWSSTDWTGTDTNGDGTVNTGAANYGGWFEVNTLTPNSDGTFDVELGGTTALPTIDFTTHKYLQVEIKNAAEADTSYQLMDPTSDSGADAVDRQTLGTLPYAENAERLDNAEIGLTTGDLVTLGAGNVWDIGLIPGGSNTDTFVIDNDDTAAGDIQLQFGATLAKTLKYSQANSWFEFNSDVSFGQNEIKNVALDNLSSAPVTPVTGQIYHNTTDTNTYIWNGTSWEDITAGVGANQNKSMLLLPEYDKITISEDSSSNMASIHQGYDDVSDHPYFVLSSAQGTLQDLDVYLAVRIPDDFVMWQATPVQLYLKSLTADSADNQLDLSITDTNKANVPLTGATDLISAAPDTWIQKNITFGGVPTWTVGDFMMIRLSLQAKSDNKIYIGEVQLNYVGN